MMPIEEERQEIRNQHVNPTELELHPSEVRQFDVGNKFERRLSYIVGYDGSKFHMVKTAPDGTLKVYASPPIFSRYAVLRDTIDGSTVTELKLEADEFFSRIDIHVFDATALVQFGYEPLQLYGSEIKLQPGFYSFDYMTKKVRVTIPDGGDPTEVQIVVWY